MEGLKVLKFAWAKVPLLIGAGLCILVIGEVNTRLPFVQHRLEYLPDRDIVGLLQPSQKGYEWLASQSLRSPDASINSDGHRGLETNWDEPVLVALGSSEAFGLGVTESEVWTSVMEQSLRERGQNWEVVNAAGLGFGAYHQAAVMERIAEAHAPEAFLVSLSIGERFFEPIPEDQRDATYASALRRQEIRRYTKFLPFLYRKLSSQLSSIRAALQPWRSSGGGQRPPTAAAAVGEFMVAKDQEYWAQMIAIAEEQNVPILFVVRDPWSYASSRVLEETLAELTAAYDGASVVRIGADAFGLEQFSPEVRDEHYRQEFTLVIDPHANARQHRILGEAIADEVSPVLVR